MITILCSKSLPRQSKISVFRVTDLKISVHTYIFFLGGGGGGGGEYIISCILKGISKCIKLYIFFQKT